MYFYVTFMYWNIKATIFWTLRVWTCFLHLVIVVLRKLRSCHSVPSLDGKQMAKQWKQWKTLFFLGGWDGSKITEHGDCSHEIKRLLLLWRKAMTNLYSILESRDITLPKKFCVVKAMIFPVVMYGCESWTTKKAEHQRIDAFELWCWGRLLRVPWTARRSNQ